MIAVCLALKAAGHDVCLIGPPEKAPWAAQLGCPYREIGQDVTAFLNPVKNALSLKSGIAFVRFLRQEIKTQFALLPEMIQHADLVVASSLVFSLSSIAGQFNIPYRYMAFTPQLFPSAFHPLPVIKSQTLPKWCNTLSWQFARCLDRFNIAALVNAHRRNMGLDPVKDVWDHILGKNTILACDRQIAAIPKDINRPCVQTGYPHLDVETALDPELEKFLEQGTKPFYAGFGSLPPLDQQKTLPMVVSTARALGRRMIINQYWSETAEPVLNKKIGSDVLFIQQSPHLRLFPKTAAVIHHGGAGTTAAAAVSGVPQVIVPHILDQYYNGQQVYYNHLGPEPIQKSRLTEKKLKIALETCMTDPVIQTHVKNARAAIDPEMSLARIVRTIVQD